MKIKRKILEKINASTKLKTQLALALNKSVFSIQRYIDENDDNLTKASVLKVIREELGLSDSQILEESTTKAA